MTSLLVVMLLLGTPPDGSGSSIRPSHGELAQVEVHIVSLDIDVFVGLSIKDVMSVPGHIIATPDRLGEIEKRVSALVPRKRSRISDAEFRMVAKLDYQDGYSTLLAVPTTCDGWLVGERLYNPDGELLSLLVQAGTKDEQAGWGPCIRKAKRIQTRSANSLRR
jgi:hypothetical protein